MIVLAIDPGNEKSAYCFISSETLEPGIFGKVDNDDLISIINLCVYDRIVIERVASYGMAVGRDVFETCEWIGRFKQVVGDCDYVYRKDEKMNLCGTMKADDKMIRRALIDRFAKFDKKYGKGKLNKPDYFYGVHTDIWSAIAVAVTYLDKEAENGTKEV